MIVKILDALKNTIHEKKIIPICNMLIRKGLFNYKEILAKYNLKE